MCVGNSSGEVLVYDAVSGNLVARLKHPRVKQMQITACAFTHDARYSSGWRWCGRQM
jgi:hypothetical protein